MRPSGNYSSGIADFVDGRDPVEAEVADGADDGRGERGDDAGVEAVNPAVDGKLLAALPGVLEDRGRSWRWVGATIRVTAVRGFVAGARRLGLSGCRRVRGAVLLLEEGEKRAVDPVEARVLGEHAVGQLAGVPQQGGIGEEIGEAQVGQAALQGA